MLKLKLMKKVITTGFMVGALSGLSWAEGPEQATRDLQSVKDIFQGNQRQEAFNIINGTGGGSTPRRGGGGAKGSDLNVPNQLKTLSPGVFCVQNSQWAAYPSAPAKVGQPATDLVDSNGRPVVPMLIEALRGKKEATVTVDVTLRGTVNNAPERRTYVALDKDMLGGTKGEKFFCATSYKTPMP